MLKTKGRNNQLHLSHPLKKTGGFSVVDPVKSFSPVNIFYKNIPLPGVLKYFLLGKTDIIH